MATDWTKASEKECRDWCKARGLIIDVVATGYKWYGAPLHTARIFEKADQSRSVFDLQTRADALQTLRMACAAAEAREGGRP